MNETIQKGWLLAVIPGLVSGILMIVAGVFIVVLLLLKLLWAWTIPDLFPGAVEQGLVVGKISWYTALKVAIFVSVLAGIAGIRKDRDHGKTS
jgi:hypothetical protein